MKLAPFHDQEGRLIGHFPDVAEVWPPGSTTSVKGPRWAAAQEARARRRARGPLQRLYVLPPRGRP